MPELRGMEERKLNIIPQRERCLAPESWGMEFSSSFLSLSFISTPTHSEQMTAKQIQDLSTEEKAARLSKALDIEDYEARSIMFPDSLESVTFWARRMTDDQKRRYAFWMSAICGDKLSVWEDEDPRHIGADGYHEVPYLDAFDEMTASEEKHAQAFILAVLVVPDAEPSAASPSQSSAV